MFPGVGYLLGNRRSRLGLFTYCGSTPVSRYQVKCCKSRDKAEPDTGDSIGGRENEGKRSTYMERKQGSCIKSGFSSLGGISVHQIFCKGGSKLSKIVG